jgi:hypothetical protein
MSENSTSVCSAGCGKPGTLKCPCSKVAYCTKACQKKDWVAGHKKVCTLSKKNRVSGNANNPKSENSTSSKPRIDYRNTTNGNPQELLALYGNLQHESQQAHRQHDFGRVVSLTEKAIEVVSQFPEPLHSLEMVQCYMNLTSAYAQLRSFDKGDHASEKCLTKCDQLESIVNEKQQQMAHMVSSSTEKGFQGKEQMQQTIGYIQKAKEVLMNAYATRSQFVVTLTDLMGRQSVSKGNGSKMLTNEMIQDRATKLKDGLLNAEKAHKLSKEMPNIPKYDPFLFKLRRSMALLHDKLGNFKEGEKILYNAYKEVSCDSSSYEQKTGFENLDLQEIILEELVSLLMRRNEVSKAAKYAQEDYENLIKKRKISPNHLCIGDTLARLAQLQMCIENKGEEADENMVKSLEIREQAFKNKDSENAQEMKETIIADSLMMLSKIRESRDIITPETEHLLLRAQDIYQRNTVEGNRFNFHLQVQNDIQRIRAKLSGTYVPFQKEEEEEDSEDNGSGSDSDVSDVKTVPPKQKNVVKAPKKLIKKKEPAPKYTFPKNDANSRMQAAQSLYENEYFGAAARIFEEAVAIFTEQYGPEHEYTQSAMQNMLIATNNEIIQLWREVVDESVEKYHQEQASSKKNDSIVDDDTW